MAEISFRAAKPEDAARLLEIYGHYVKNTVVSFEYEVLSEEDFANRIRKTLVKYPYILAVCEDKIIGYAYAGALNERRAASWAAEASIYLDKDFRRQGTGRKLYDELERVLKAQGFLSVYALIAWPDEEDEYLTWDSVNFHQRCGYEIAGRLNYCGHKFGRWYSLVWMEKQLGERTAAPAEPIPFCEMKYQE